MAPRPVASTQAARILLVEDDDISQEVALTILKNAGYGCEVACNGRLAVEAVQCGDFDLVLMDCQMPEMDGFSAARAIRSWESETIAGGQPRRIPIIALTANALKGDRERCLEAGMDDYISKPLEARRLLELIEGKLRARAASSTDLDSDDPKTRKGVAVISELEQPPFDLVSALQRWAGDQKILDRLLSLFEERAAAAIIQLQQGITNENAAEISRLAHTLKGAAGYLAGNDLCNTARDVEAAFLATDIERAQNCVSALREELKRCLAFVPRARERMAAASGERSEVDRANSDCG